MSDPAAPAAPVGTVASVINSIMSGIETGIFAVVLAVLTAFMPQLISLTANDLLVIGNNFRQFLVAVGGGQPWGAALSDMLDGDWNTVSDSGKAAATDFAEAVATALEKMDLLPQGQ